MPAALRYYGTLNDSSQYPSLSIESHKMWVIECIEYKYLLCGDIWDKKHEWRDADDKSTAPQTKARTAKAHCKDWTEKIEHEHKESEEKDGKKQQLRRCRHRTRES